MKTYYVYLLTDPRNNNSVFYCGKGTGDRWKSHLGHWSGNGKNNPTENRIKKIQSEGLEPGVIFLHENITDENLAYKLEEEYIKENFDQLTNLKIKAQPPDPTGRIPWNKGKKMPKHIIEKGVQKRIGKKKNFQDKNLWRKKISESLQGEKHPMYGKPALARTPVREITTNQVFPSQTDAAMVLGIKQGDIANCIAGRQKTVKGYKFKFEVTNGTQSQ